MGCCDADGHEPKLLLPPEFDSFPIYTYKAVEVPLQMVGIDVIL